MDFPDVSNYFTVIIAFECVYGTRSRSFDNGVINSERLTTLETPTFLSCAIPGLASQIRVFWMVSNSDSDLGVHE
jgi:hypothetical protein